ncbi:DUF4209 domain-containing protein [Veillonella tobetsuensis]|uniref:DUF4209 domain-containing protein n=1 Tax=Veillonella tobetsuensis TaxID=1110546 RepID=UPI000750C2DA|nr:DUF4209 domain-containing protein [Veillonella tobetsuensis]
MDIYSFLGQYNNTEYGLDYELFIKYNESDFSQNLDKDIFNLLARISEIGFRFNEGNIIYNPLFLYEDGSRSFYIDDLSDEDFNLLKKINNKLSNNVKAFIADLIWTQKKDYEYSNIAINAYYELFKVLKNNIDSKFDIEIIRRALFIAAQIKNDDFSKSCCDQIYSFIISDALSYGDCFKRIYFIDILIQYDRDRLSDLIGILDKEIELSKDNLYRTEHAYKSKLKCLKVLKQSESIKLTNIALANFFVNYADCLTKSSLDNILIAKKCYVDAIELYRNNGKTQEAIFIHEKVEQIEPLVVEQLQPLKVELNVTSIIEEIKNDIKGLSLEECIIYFLKVVDFPRKDSLKQRIKDELKISPLASMIPVSIVNKTGRVLCLLDPIISIDIDADSFALDRHLAHKLLIETQIYSLGIEYLINHIKQTFDVTPEALDFLVEDNLIIPENRGSIFKYAIYLFFNDRRYEAMHIFAPQVENLFRELAKNCGGSITTFDNHGIGQVKLLKSIFETAELLECYNSDILFLFRSLLIEIACGNIRNDIAHGLLDEDDIGRSEYSYFFGALIKLILYTSKKAFSIIKDSNQLKQILMIK